MGKITIAGACTVFMFSMPALAAPAGQVDDVPKPAVTSDLEMPVYQARSGRLVDPDGHLVRHAAKDEARIATANDDARTSDDAPLSNTPPR